MRTPEEKQKSDTKAMEKPDPKYQTSVKQKADPVFGELILPQ